MFPDRTKIPFSFWNRYSVAVLLAPELVSISPNYRWRELPNLGDPRLVRATPSYELPSSASAMNCSSFEVLAWSRRISSIFDKKPDHLT
jgi:hypothetical protein